MKIPPSLGKVSGRGIRDDLADTFTGTPKKHGTEQFELSIVHGMPASWQRLARRYERRAVIREYAYGYSLARARKRLTPA